MKNIFLIALISMALMSACKKEESNSEPKYPDYGCLKVGNYWIYERFVVDTFGVAVTLNQFDSCYVEKDTLINGETYAKIARPHLYKDEMVFTYLRDSLHYLVDNNGMIRFSSIDTSTVFFTHYSIISNGDTIYKLTVKMDDINQRIVVPAGEFTTMNYKATYKMKPSFGPLPIRIAHMRYAKDVGLVVETLPMFASIPTTTERRLVRYYINQTE